MALQDRITALAQAVGADIKSVLTALSGKENSGAAASAVTAHEAAADPHPQYASAAEAAAAAPVQSVAGKTGAVALAKADVGLGNVDNTADANKSVASAAKLTTARAIGGVSFDGSADIHLPGVNAAGNQNTTGNAATATKLATARTINGVSFDGTTNATISTIYDASRHRITNPPGGSFVSTAETRQGAITLTLPVGMTNTMMQIKVKVFDFTANLPFEICLGGYNWEGNIWLHTFAYISANPSVNRQFTVRFGKNAAGQAVIYIGELDSVWHAVQVFITDVQLGFLNLIQEWLNNWSISFTTTAFENVSSTVTSPQIGCRVTPIGYVTGAGGYVEQPTNKNARVTLNKPCGQIKMAPGGIPSGGFVFFWLTNNTIDADDVLLVTLNTFSLGTASYQIQALVASGEALISVTQSSGTPLDERLIINFAVIKGAVA